MPHSRISNLSPGRIAQGYAVIAILWIAFSDAVVSHFKLHPFVMTIKGTVFVFVTASLLYFTIRRLVHAVQRTSQERDETAELYRTVVEASNEGICLLDESGRISFLNGRLAAMLGRPAEELEGKRLQDFIEEPHVLAQPGAQQSETRECRLRKDSDPKPWVLISRHSVLNEAGDVVGLVVTVIDITECKRAEKALRRSEAYLAEIPEAPENLRESQLPSLARYGLAILSVGVALAAALFFQYLHFRDVAIPVLLLAVAISSWSGGRGPATLAAILSTISFYWYFVEPVQTIYIYWSNVPYFIIFVAFATLVSWFATIRRRVEAGLQEQAALLNLTHDTVFVMDMEGIIKYWNRGAEEQYGWSAEQALGKVVHDMLKTVFPSPLEEIKAEVTRRGRWEGELLHTNKHGTQLVVTSRWSLQRDRHGAAVAILETNNDISERKRAEEALSRLNRELRAISDCNQVLLRATDEQSLLEKICRIVCEEAGYRMAWVAYAEHDEAKSVRPVAWSGAEAEYLASAGITWADTENGCSPTGTAIRSGKTCCIQDFATDPRLAPWRESALQRGFRSTIALPLKDEHGNAFGSLTIYSAQPNAFTSEEIRLLEELAADLAFGIVTLRSRAARKQAEEALRESETRFRTFVDHAGDALFVQDLEQGTIVDVNRQACESLGYNRQELIGKTPLGFHVDSGRAEIEAVAERTAAGETTFDRHWHRRKDGLTFPVEIHTSLVSYGGRRFLLKVARDISDRVRAEEQRDRLRQLEAELAHLDRLTTLGELTASIAHEVNQPLSGVVSNGSACLRFLAGDAPNVEEAREAVRDIVRDGKRAGEIIARIRALAKKRAATQKEELDLNETTREVLALVGDEAKKKGVITRTQFADDLSPVSGDRVQLQQVMLNLVVNAMEAMNSVGDRARELVLTTRNLDAEQVQVTVEDSGTGLDPDTIDKIFNPFFTTKPGGMGMGLSISRSILQAHGGRLWATVNDGPGTSFHFTLPKYHDEEPNAGVAGV